MLFCVWKVSEWNKSYRKRKIKQWGIKGKEKELERNRKGKEKGSGSEKMKMKKKEKVPEKQGK